MSAHPLPEVHCCQQGRLVTVGSSFVTALEGLEGGGGTARWQ